MMAVQGRRLALTDPVEVQRIVDEYFESRIATRKVHAKGADGETVVWEEQYEKPPTMAGLALALDITRSTLMAYGKGEGPRDPEISIVLSRAKERIAAWVEEALYTREASNGARFALEVNHGYGRETAGETGDGFTMRVIPPIVDAPLAIAKWESDDE